MGQGVLPDRADAWIAAYEAKKPYDVAQRGGAYWNAAFAWIAAERRRG
jgi:hypothetical protein